MASIYWSGSPNGNIPHSKLAPAPNFSPLAGSPASVAKGSNLTMPEAARQLSGLQAAFFKRFGRKLLVRELYRPLEVQEFWKRYYTALGKPQNAATPGYSNHGWALSGDFGVGPDNRDFNAEELAWMKANAPRYGFLNDVPWEAWHWTYLAQPTIVVTDIEPEEEDMTPQQAAQLAQLAKDVAIIKAEVVGPTPTNSRIKQILATARKLSPLKTMKGK